MLLSDCQLATSARGLYFTYKGSRCTVPHSSTHKPSPAPHKVTTGTAHLADGACGLQGLEAHRQ